MRASVVPRTRVAFKKSAGNIPACPPGTRLVTLDNGLTIIVREDHSAPVVSAQAWCLTGSIHEGRWLGGLKLSRGVHRGPPRARSPLSAGSKSPASTLFDQQSKCRKRAVT